MSGEQQLAVVDGLTRELANTTEIKDMLALDKKAEALQRVFFKDSQLRPEQIRIVKFRAELARQGPRAIEMMRAGGEISEQSPGRPAKLSGLQETRLKSLKELGVGKTKADAWRKIRAIPEHELEAFFDAATQGDKEVSLKEVVNLGKKYTRNEEIEEIASNIDARTPDGTFNVINIDPPWPYGTKYDSAGRRAANPYPEMTLEEIAAINLPAAPDCVLWLWTTHKFMRHSFDLLDNWGFKDKAILTWVKDRMGLGEWLRSQSEFCIMAVKGKPKVNLTNQTTVIYGPLREHSRKPDEFYAMVDELCIGRKIDWFSRERREGWEQFGNDTAKFVD